MATRDKLLRDVFFFIKDDLSDNITDPKSSARSGTSKFVMTSYPQREAQYPIITIKASNVEATRAGMQTTLMDISITLEIRVWAKNERDKDTIATAILDRLADVQFTGSGSVNNNFHDFQILSMNEIDGPGEGGIKSRVIQCQYNFFDQ